MFKGERYINAGEIEFYKYGKKAQERLAKALTPNGAGFYNIPANGGEYWTIGTSEGKFGEYAKFDGKFLPVNSYGNVWAKVGTEKAETFVAMVTSMLKSMEGANENR